MSETKNNGWVKQLLKALGVIAIVILALAVVGFGLLVGICGLTR